jgi:hypothetical protein
MRPCAASTNARHTASGAGRNSGGSHCRCVAIHHSAASAASVAALSADVLPAPAAGSDATRAPLRRRPVPFEVGGRSIGRPRILRTHVVLPVQCGDAHAPG